MSRKLTEWTDDELDSEIQRLSNSAAVRIARAEQREKYRKQQHIYNLRTLERRGNELISLGYTLEDFGARYEEDAEYEGQ